jgi:hypothetical protein
LRASPEVGLQLVLSSWTLVLSPYPTHLYGASIDGFGDFVYAMVHLISLIDCKLKKIDPLEANNPIFYSKNGGLFIPKSSNPLILLVLLLLAISKNA